MWIPVQIVLVGFLIQKRILARAHLIDAIWRVSSRMGVGVLNREQVSIPIVGETGLSGQRINAFQELIEGAVLILCHLA